MTDNEIGKMIGIIDHTFGYMSNTGVKGQVSAKFDCSTATLPEIKSWIAGNRAIARQRVFKTMTANDITETSGNIVIAQDCGKKVKSIADTVEMIYNGFISTGMSEEDARKYADMAASNTNAVAVALEKNKDTSLEDNL